MKSFGMCLALMGALLACDAPKPGAPPRPAPVPEARPPEPAAGPSPGDSVAREVDARGPVADAEDPAAHKYFGDTPLVDQNGREVRFYSDLIKGKVVVINVFFATCSSVCPVVSRTLGKLQERLGDRLGQEVHMLSITVDPADTPERLKAYAQQVQAKPGWYFLTGDKENVDAVLGRLGQGVKTPDQHSTVLLVGNTRTGLWKKVLGLSNPDQVIEAVMSVVDDQGEGTGKP